MAGLNFNNCDADRLGDIGIRQDLLIKQGSTFTIRGTLENPIEYVEGVPQPQTPVDPTGCSIVAVIRKKALDTAIIATFSFEILDFEIENASYELLLTDEVTAAIVAGEKVTDAASKYVWDSKLIDTAGRVIPLYYGDVEVFRDGAHA